MLSVSDSTVFAKMLRCHQKTTKSQEIIEIMSSGYDAMKRIEAEGKFDGWVEMSMRLGLSQCKFLAKISAIQ